MLNYQITLDLFDYIDKEDDYIPWKAANDGISHIGSMFSKISVAGRNYPVCFFKFVSSILKIMLSVSQSRLNYIRRNVRRITVTIGSFVC